MIISHPGAFCKRALIPVNTPQGMKAVLLNVMAKPSESSCGPVLTPDGAASSGEEVSTDGTKIILPPSCDLISTPMKSCTRRSMKWSGLS